MEGLTLYMLTSLLHNDFCSNAPRLSLLKGYKSIYLFKIATCSRYLYVLYSSELLSLTSLCTCPATRCICTYFCAYVPSAIVNTYEYLRIWKHSLCICSLHLCLNSGLNCTHYSYSSVCACT